MCKEKAVKCVECKGGALTNLHFYELCRIHHFPFHHEFTNAFVVLNADQLRHWRHNRKIL